MKNKDKIRFDAYMIIGWTVRIIVAYIFASHGIKALLQSPTMLEYFTFLGFSSTIAALSLLLVGVIDLAVVGFLLLKPIKIIVIWTMIWPIVPTIMSQVINPDELSHFVIHLFEHIIPGAILYLVLFTPFFKKTVEKFRGRDK